MHKITIDDCRRHQPDGDPRWQESFYLGWVDLKNRACGANHISLAPALEPIRVSARPGEVFEVGQRIFAEIDTSQITLVQ